MHPILPRTYAVGPLCQAPTFEMRCMAGLLSGGSTSVLTGAAGGRVLGIWDRGDEAVQVAVLRGWRRNPPEGFRFHRSAGLWLPRRRISVGPLQVASVPDLCLQLARTVTPWQLAYIIGRSLYRRLVTLGELERAIGAHARNPWITVLRRAVALVASGSAGTRSSSEDVLLGSLLAGLAREPVVNTRGAMGLARDEPDFVWTDRKLNVEVDGRHHDDPHRAADDALRDEEARLLGYTVIRVPAADVWRRRRSVVDLVLRALAGEAVPIDPATRRVILR